MLHILSILYMCFTARLTSTKDAGQHIGVLHLWPHLGADDLSGWPPGADASIRPRLLWSESSTYDHQHILPPRSPQSHLAVECGRKLCSRCFSWQEQEDNYEEDKREEEHVGHVPRRKNTETHRDPHCQYKGWCLLGLPCSIYIIYIPIPPNWPNQMITSRTNGQRSRLLASWDRCFWSISPKPSGGMALRHTAPQELRRRCEKAGRWWWVTGGLKAMGWPFRSCFVFLCFL